MKLIAWGAVCIALALATVVACGDQQETDALKLGLLLNLSGGTNPRAVERQRAFDLAVKHLNDAGGVFGKPVETVVGDSTRDPETAVAVARRMVEDDGVHAIVGPTTSANSLLVIERVLAPTETPAVSPSATSPRLTDAADDDFFFRAALSDNSQGPVLARVTSERGFNNVGVVYIDDAWGQGLYESFAQAWTGTISAVPVARAQDSYLAELERTAVAGAEALVVITFDTEAVTIVRDALESGLYDQFTFGDASKSPDLVREIGGERLGGMYGVAGVSALDNPVSAAWESAYVAEYGAAPAFAYVKETYDATIALALAAQAAGSIDGAAIRDRLREVGGEPGEAVTAGAEGVAAALAALADGGEVDYDGASSTMDWDENGDLLRGHVGVWRFTQDERIEELEAIPVEN